jgi:type I restriction enzyme M protein
VQKVKSISTTAPELIDRIRSGDLNVPEAERLAALPPEERRKPSYNCTHHFDRVGQPSDIETPPAISQFLYDIISPKYDVGTILDPCAGNRNLTKPWKRRKVIAYEIKRGKDFFDCPDHIDCDLVLCNPPFSSDNGGTRVNLVPLFLRRILEVVPARTPIVLFTPMTFRLGLYRTATRLRWLRDECPPVTSIISLPRDIFPGVEYHCEILCFNLRKLKPHYFLPDECL